MICVQGHEMQVYGSTDEYTEYYCQSCDMGYWYNPQFGLNRFDEDDPCEAGLHDWISIWEDDEEVGMECRRCGMIDM